VVGHGLLEAGSVVGELFQPGDLGWLDLSDRSRYSVDRVAVADDRRIHPKQAVAHRPADRAQTHAGIDSHRLMAYHEDLTYPTDQGRWGSGEASAGGSVGPTRSAVDPFLVILLARWGGERMRHDRDSVCATASHSLYLYSFEY
jgi:hypothetical protein